MTSSPLSSQAAAQMLSTLIRLREALEAARLPLALPDVELARKGRAEMLDQLEDYILPRLIQLDAPVLTVVGGSTGAGKSTLVNSLVGQRVTEPGVLRPTTRSPVLVFNPADADWFTNPRILPDLRRTGSASGDPGALQLVSSMAIPPGLAVLDAPDIDSVEEQNRILAAQLLGAADLWLFVTSAARYADQVPWEFLKAAAERSAAVALVLDRTDPLAVGEVSTHLARMMSARGLRDSPLFTVPEGEVDHEGLLPSHTVREIRAWLSSLAADTTARQALVQRTLEGAIRTLGARAFAVADACHDQVGISARLRREAESSYEAALNGIDHAAADGTLLRGGLLTLWREFVDNGEVARGLDAEGGRVRGVGKGPQHADLVTASIGSGLQALVLEYCEAAAENTVASWRTLAAGRELLDSLDEDLARASRGLRTHTDRLAQEWHQAVQDLIRNVAGDRLANAGFEAHGVNGLAVSLMVAVLGSTDPAGTRGPAAVATTVLQSVVDAETVRRLVAGGRADLNNRLLLLLDAEQRRFSERLDALGITAHVEDELRAAARNLDDIRFAAYPL